MFHCSSSWPDKSRGERMEDAKVWPETSSNETDIWASVLCLDITNACLKNKHPRKLTRQRGWLRHCATSRKVAGSIPDGVNGIFRWHNPSGRTMVRASWEYSNIYPTRCKVTQFILSGNCSTCFGWYHHPSSGAETTVSTASGICHTVVWWYHPKHVEQFPDKINCVTLHLVGYTVYLNTDICFWHLSGKL